MSVGVVIGIIVIAIAIVFAIVIAIAVYRLRNLFNRSSPDSSGELPNPSTTLTDSKDIIFKYYSQQGGGLFLLRRDVVTVPSGSYTAKGLATHINSHIPLFRSQITNIAIQRSKDTDHLQARYEMMTQVIFPVDDRYYTFIVKRLSQDSGNYSLVFIIPPEILIGLGARKSDAYREPEDIGFGSSEEGFRIVVPLSGRIQRRRIDSL